MSDQEAPPQPAQQPNYEPIEQQDAAREQDTHQPDENRISSVKLPSTNNTDEKDTCIELQQCCVHPKGRAAPLVDDISMHVAKGEIFGILGPSGCGKSTLFSLLSRRLRQLDDWCVYAKTFTIPENVVLVPQHDVFYPYDTPIKALSFIYQKTKFCSDAEANEKALAALELIGLASEDKVNTQLGEAGYNSPFTGGERRLLAVARALMTQPDAILLDEPTSGLDAWTALDLVKKIKTIAAKSKTSFVFTVHQPSDALVHEFGDNILRLTPPLPKAEPTGLATFSYPPHNNHHTLWGWCFLLVILLRRQTIRYIANPAACALQVGGAFFLALLLGVSYVDLPFDDPKHIPDVIGFTSATITSTFAPIVFGSTLFPLEKAHFMDENPLCDTRYLIADSLARFVIDVVMSGFQSLVLLIAFAMIGVEAIGDFYLTVWLQFWASNAFGFLMSTLAEPHVSIGTLIPNVAYLSFAFGSGFIAPEKSGSGWIFHVVKWASFVKYGVASLMITELPRANGTCTGPCLYSNGDQVLEQVELKGDDFIYTNTFQQMMMIVICVVLRFLALMAIRHLIRTGVAKFYYTPSSAGAVMKKDESEDAEQSKNEPFSGEETTTTPNTVNTISEGVEMEEKISPTSKGKYYKIVVGDIVESLGPKHVVAAGEQRFKKKTVLKGRTIRIEESTFTAVLGPTGCGKSVLLQAIAARLGAGLDNPPASPQIFSHKADPINIQFDDGRDGFMPFVSVLEATIHGARMHFPAMSEEELEAHVMTHLAAFGLAPKAKDSVHKLSGGESKRLQVVTKLVTLPQILVLDEPTVGLDSDAAQALLDHLSHIAKNGVEGKPVTIICSLKQPEPRNIGAFDHFLFLDHEGSLLVEGDATACRNHFGIDEEHAAIWADAALLCIHGEGIHHLLVGDAVTASGDEKGEEGEKPQAAVNDAVGDDDDNLKKNDDAAVTIQATTLDDDDASLHQQALSTEHHSFGRAFAILAKRNLEQRWIRNPLGTLGVFCVRYFLLPVTFSILLWDIGGDDDHFNNRSALLFIFGGSHLFSTFISTAIVFPLERPVIEGEILSNQYSPLAYLCMQWFAMPFVEDMVGVCIICILLKFCTGLDIAFGWFFLATFTMSQAAIGFGTIFGLFRSIVIAAGLAVGSMLPMMFSSGVILSTYQMARTGIYRAIEAMSISRMAYLISFDSELEEGTKGNAALKDQYWELFGFNNPSWWYRVDVNWGMLCFWLVLMRLVCIVLFKRQFRMALARQH